MRSRSVEGGEDGGNVTAGQIHLCDISPFHSSNSIGSGALREVALRNSNDIVSGVLAGIDSRIRPTVQCALSTEPE